jgi:hypothetical protein
MSAETLGLIIVIIGLVWGAIALAALLKNGGNPVEELLAMPSDLFGSDRQWYQRVLAWSQAAIAIGIIFCLMGIGSGVDTSTS